jgi:hypothetical protein
MYMPAVVNMRRGWVGIQSTRKGARHEGGREASSYSSDFVFFIFDKDPPSDAFPALAAFSAFFACFRAFRSASVSMPS